MKKIYLYGQSRSGTTLLSAILDAHPKISFGSELLNTWQGKSSDFIAYLATVKGETLSELSTKKNLEGDFKKFNKYIIRCFRAGLTWDDIHEGFCDVSLSKSEIVLDLDFRIGLASSLMMRRAKRDGNQIIGHKVPGSNPLYALEKDSSAFAVCIYRDPYDVVNSHNSRNFDKAPEDIIQDWMTYVNNFNKAKNALPDRVTLVRYEDLIMTPIRVTKDIFEGLKSEWSPDVLKFYASESNILKSNHPNTDDLKTNFNAKKLNVGRKVLTPSVKEIIASKIRDVAVSNGYDDGSYLFRYKGKTTAITQNQRKTQLQKFKVKRKFALSDYGRMFEYAWKHAFEIGTIRDFHRSPKLSGFKYLQVRHDVDHDLDTALKIASWEKENGIQATYCLLHTAWYYGKLEDNRYLHSDFLLDAIRELRSLGHEINFHNNLVALALTNDINPIELLKNELEFFNKIGAGVVGSSTHGDALCRTLGFRNWEIFRECCDNRFGGPRKVSYTHEGVTRSVNLGTLNMSELGLEYEAYDYGKNHYQTDSGGIMRHRENTVSRSPHCNPSKRKFILDGILTHPIWWSTEEINELPPIPCR